MSGPLLRPDRKLLASLAVLFLLVVLYVAGFFVGRPAGQALFFPHFTPARADSILLAQGSAKTELRRSGKRWEVIIDGSPYPADQSRIAGILSALRGLSVLRVASRSKADWNAFALEQSTAVRVVVHGGNETLADVLAGVTDASGGGLYVRRPGGTSVEEVTPQLAGYAVVDASFWSDLKVVPPSFTVSTMQSISVDAQGFSVGQTTLNEHYLLEASVTGGATEWKLHGEPQVALNQQKVLDLEAELLTMTGDQFAGSVSDSAAGINTPLARVTISNEQGGSVTLLVGKRSGSRFYVKRSDAPYIYLVNQYSLRRAMPTPASLQAK